MVKTLYQKEIDTPLGPLLALADESHLWLLEFLDSPHLPLKVKRLGASVLKNASCQPLHHIQKELELYFAGKLFQFTTPTHLTGTPFQQKVRRALSTIPFGSTFSYQQLAKAIDSPNAYRSVATANQSNPLCIIIPCHRVIYANGSIGGYSSGQNRKEWLLTHERSLR